MTIKERTTPTLSFEIRDGAGNLLTPATLVLTLRNVRTGAVINSREAQNVLNANGVTVAAGVVTWAMTQADTTLVDQTRAQETYRAWFDYTWAGGSKRDHHALELQITNEREIAA